MCPAERVDGRFHLFFTCCAQSVDQHFPRLWIQLSKLIRGTRLVLLAIFGVTAPGLSCRPQACTFVSRAVHSSLDHVIIVCSTCRERSGVCQEISLENSVLSNVCMSSVLGLRVSSLWSQGASWESHGTSFSGLECAQTRVCLVLGKRFRSTAESFQTKLH